MAITAGGVGSGLDINGIVYQLMQLERIPVDKLEAQNKELDSQLSAYGKLRSSLSSFKTAMDGLASFDKFKIFSTASSDEAVLTASANSSAAAGTYSLDVTQLAQNHKIGTSGAEAIGSTDVFTGTLDITISGNTMQVPAGAGMTLAQIRDYINNAADNPGLTATILNLGSSDQKLVLTADESGENNAITNIVDNMSNTSNNLATLSLQTLNKDALGGDIDLGTLSKLNAAFTIDGFSVSSASNAISDVIEGLTLSLKSLGTTELTLSRDDSEIEKSVESFVKSYNDLYDTLATLSAGDLAGDSTLRSIQSAVRNVYSTSISGLTGTYTAPFQIGLNSDSKTGKLSLDSEDFKKALETDFSSVADIFANDDQGVAFRLKELADALLSNNNVVDTREDGIRSRQKAINSRIDSWEARLELKEVALRAKFASLDAFIGGLQSTSTFIANSLF